MSLSFSIAEDRRGPHCLQRFLIFHREEMALGNKQPVIHEKQEFVKLRLQD